MSYRKCFERRYGCKGIYKLLVEKLATISESKHESESEEEFKKE